MSNSEKARAAAFIGSGLSRKVVSTMILKAFPAPSRRATAERGAPVLGISVRHMRRLIGEEHDASATLVLALMALVGFEVALAIILRSTGK